MTNEERLENKICAMEVEILQLRAEVKKLRAQSIEDSWKGEVDRMSGAFSQEEIDRARNGYW